MSKSYVKICLRICQLVKYLICFVISYLDFFFREIMEKKLFYLELSSEPIRFDSVSQLTNVFFDDSNRQVSKSEFFNWI